jgi:beta-glucanase (GH16 family)
VTARAGEEPGADPPRPATKSDPTQARRKISTQRHRGCRASGTAAVLILMVIAVACTPSSVAATPPGRSSYITTRNNLTPDPSGVRVPTGNIPGWNLVYNQDFNGTSLPAGWGAYSGQPGGTRNDYWDPANVTVSNGELHLGTTASDAPQRRGAYSTGGVSFYGHPQTYGMYLVRLKGDYEPGLKISDIALLWPSTKEQTWPPEIDFFEDAGGTRSTFSANLHVGPDGDNCCVIKSTLANDATGWHTYGIEWTSTAISYTIDGHRWGHVIYKSHLIPPAQWPSIEMNLDLQSQNLGPAQPAMAIKTMTVDWVAEYTRSS